MQTRRGATLVFVAVMISLLIGVAGFAIDFARMYTFKSQLKVLADAAALSATVDVVRDGTTGGAVNRALSRAIALREQNRVNGIDRADITQTDFVPGTWNFNTQTFTPNPGRSWQGATAVQATARYTAEWTLARVFGVTTRDLAETSIATIGAANEGCIKPFVLPYLNLVQMLHPDITDPGYELTPEDLDALSSSVQRTFRLADDTPAPGNFGWVSSHSKYEPAPVGDLTADPNPNKQLANRLASCMNVAGGKPVFGVPGARENSEHLEPGIHSICPPPARAGPGEDLGKLKYSCQRALEMDIPIYSTYLRPGDPGAQGETVYTVKFLGRFKLTGVNFKNEVEDRIRTDGTLTGNFIVLRSSLDDKGGFAPGLGLIPSRGASLVR